MLSVSFDRTSLELPALVIGGAAPVGDGFFVAHEGIAEPTFEAAVTYAPDSLYQHGSQALSARLTISSLPLSIYAQAATSAALAVLKAELAAASWQFAYTITLTVDGVAQSWAADPSWPSWGALDSGMVAAHMARATLSIPVNPSGV